MDKWFYPTFYCACDYLSMLGLKLNHVSKRARSQPEQNTTNHEPCGISFTLSQIQPITYNTYLLCGIRQILNIRHIIGQNVRIQAGKCFTTPSGFLNKFSSGCKFADVPDLQQNLYQKLDDGFVSPIRNRHLISNTNYTTGWEMKFSLAKMRYHENSLWSSLSVIKHPALPYHALDCSKLVW